VGFLFLEVIMLDKPLPNSIESENALLCALIISPEIIPIVKEKLEISDLYHEKSKVIYEGILKAPQKEMTCIWDNIDQKQVDKKYFMALATLAVSVAWEYHLENIIKLSKQRQLWYIGQTLSEQIIRPDFNIDEVISELQLKVHEINKPIEDKSQEDQWLETYTHIFEDGEPGLYTGVADLDRKFYMEQGYIHLVAAESGVGKSAFMLQISDNIAQKYPGKVLYFSLESTFERLARRLIARNSHVALTRINKNNFHDDNQVESIWQVVNRFAQGNIILRPESKYMLIEKLINYVESFLVNNKVSLICVDFLQALDSIKPFTSDRAKINYMVNRLKALAKDTNIPVLYASQLRKDIEGEPGLDDLIESNYIRFATDNILFLYSPDSSPVQYPVKCYLVKGKEQERFFQWLTFDGNFQKYTLCDQPPLIQTKHRKTKDDWQRNVK
jgi:replicative DNA helicase